MSLENTNRVLRNGGQLYVGVTDLTDSGNDYGGTPLGIHKKSMLVPRIITEEINDDLEQNRVGEVLYLGQSYNLVSWMNQWDSDAMQRYFYNYRTGGGETFPVSGTGTKTGTLNSGRPVPGTTLLFVPYKSEAADGMAIVFYNAKPRLQLAAEIRQQAIGQAEIPIVWTATPDAGGRIHEGPGPISQLTNIT